MPTDYSAKADLKNAISHLEAADRFIHEIVFHLDLEYGPDASSGLAVDVNAIARHIDDSLKEARELLSRNRGKLAIRSRK